MILVIILLIVLLSVLAVVGARRALAQPADSPDVEHDLLSAPVRAALASYALGPERLSPPAPAEFPQDGQGTERGWWETCEIVWSRGYRKSDFYALSVSPEGEPYVAGRSREFKWRRNEPPPPTDAIAAAREELVQRLIDDGWEEHASGETWYAGRYKLWNEHREPSDESENEAAPVFVPANGGAREELRLAGISAQPSLRG